MKYRQLGSTGLAVSEIGLGAEWLERHTAEECKAIIDRCESHGINILDCWMSEPKVRSNIGAAIRGKRDRWIIQGHLGSSHHTGQHTRCRELPLVKAAFADLLQRLGTDYIDIGMIYYVDKPEEWQHIVTDGFLAYVKELKQNGTVRHIGLSTHNPVVARMAVESGEVEMILFSINPAFDLLPASEDINRYFVDEYDASLSGIDPERADLYKLCEQRGVGITVMKCFAGGRLFDEKRSPFGVALTPVQCLHYCLTRPAVAAVMAGFDETSQVDDAVAYETATDEEKNYAAVLAGAPRHAYHGNCTYCGHCKPCPVNIDIALVNKLSDLAAMQPEIPPSIRSHYDSLEAKASDCIGCQDCESRCPFGVPIAAHMLNTAKRFG